MQEVTFQSKNPSLGIECNFRVMELSTFLHGGEKMLAAILDPFHGPLRVRAPPRESEFPLGNTSTP